MAGVDSHFGFRFAGNRIASMPLQALERCATAIARHSSPFDRCRHCIILRVISFAKFLNVLLIILFAAGYLSIIVVAAVIDHGGKPE